MEGLESLERTEKQREQENGALRLGERQTLTVVKRTPSGVYLAAARDKDAIDRAASAGKTAELVLLPNKYVPEGAKTGDRLEVFVYRDSEDRPVATTLTPYLTLHEVGRLRVAEVGKIGAFLDWGLEKELLLPFKQQTKPVEAGEEVLVAVYIDKSARLCATMNVYPYLQNESPYQKDDRVVGKIYESSGQFGFFVAVDDRYSALISRQEEAGELRVGDEVRARVVSVREDGRLNLSVREKAYLQMDEDAEKLLCLIDSFGGGLPFNDKASPEVIRRETGMSKKEFKRAVGRLLKQERIVLTEKGIHRK